MVHTFTKLFSSLLTSSIWCEDAETKVVWITLLALADQHGEVQAAIPGLARQAGVTVAVVEKALETFLEPDPYSRTTDNEGRRVEPIDGGWRLLNHGKYRALASAEQRREADRLRKARVRNGPQASAPCPPVSLQAEAEAEAE
jgi:hypothetical protein